jgi:hypothetical protein
MNTFLKVEGSTSLVRDVASKAIVNTSNSEYNEYIKNREIALKKIEMAESQNEKINRLEQDMAEIKQMLGMLIKGKE